MVFNVNGKQAQTVQKCSDCFLLKVIVKFRPGRYIETILNESTMCKNYNYHIIISIIQPIDQCKFLHFNWLHC